MLIHLSLLTVLSMPGLALWRWLMVAGRPNFTLPRAPKLMSEAPITLNSDYRGMVY